MPGLDGHEATRRIRARAHGRAVKIVAVSASAFEEDREAVMATGADDFVRKPITEETLLAVIERHLGLRFELAPETIETTPEPDRARLERLLEQLPPALRGEMRQAVHRSDDLAFVASLKRLPPELDELSQTLLRMARRFAWDTLESLL